MLDNFLQIIKQDNVPEVVFQVLFFLVLVSTCTMALLIHYIGVARILIKRRYAKKNGYVQYGHIRIQCGNDGLITASGYDRETIPRDFVPVPRFFGTPMLPHTKRVLFSREATPEEVRRYNLVMGT